MSATAPSGPPPPSPDEVRPAPPDERTVTVAATAAMALVLLHGVVSALCPSRVWGLGQLAISAPSVRWTAVAGTLLLLAVTWRYGAATLKVRWRAPLPGAPAAPP